MRSTGQDRLIVALDVPTAKDALTLVDDLDGIVSFFKVGWELFIGGEAAEVLRALHGRDVFLDLKVPADIERTIQSVGEACVRLGVKLLTLSDSAGERSIAAAREGRGSSPYPKLLVVPYLSSHDERDLAARVGTRPIDLAAYIVERSRAAVAAGGDGLIVSGRAIADVRRGCPQALLVSPGIRPAGSPADDHRRSATPREAIEWGADYLVVGRPIRDRATREERRAAALRIVEEIDAAPGTRPSAPA